MNPDRPSLLQLYLSFLRLGSTAFGGPSMVAYIRKLAVEQRHWMEPGEFNSGAAFCQLIPGATAMQMAAYVGLYLRGVPGAAATFLGFGSPALALMLAFAMLYTRIGSLPIVLAVFSGLQAVVVAIVVNAAWSFGKTTLKQWSQALLALVSAGLFWLNVNPLLVLGLAALAGALFFAPPAEVRAGSSAALPFAKKAFFTLLAGVALFLAGLYAFTPQLFDLAILMMKVDLTAFGGGFASVPVLFHEVVEVRRWLDGPTFMNGIALGQATPGPIVITATFIGFLLHGGAGALVATLGIFLPSFLMVVGLAPFFNRFSSSALFHKVVRGVLCSFVGLLLSVALRFGLQVQWDVWHVVLGLGALAALLRKVDILWVVLTGAVLSVWLIP